MHKLIETKVTSFQNQIAQVIKMEDDIKLVETLLPDAHISIDYEVNVQLYVKSIDEVKEVLRLFASNGHLLKEFVKAENILIWRLNGINFPICLIVHFPEEGSEEAEGATCVRVKVDEVTRVEPVYKIICHGKDALEDAS
jgi:hypothetical protein